MMNSVGEGTGSPACLGLDGRLNAGIRHHPKAHWLSCLVVAAGSRLAQSRELTSQEEDAM